MHLGMAIPSNSADYWFIDTQGGISWQLTLSFFSTIIQGLLKVNIIDKYQFVSRSLVFSEFNKDSETISSNLIFHLPHQFQLALTLATPIGLRRAVTFLSPHRPGFCNKSENEVT